MRLSIQINTYDQNILESKKLKSIFLLIAYFNPVLFLTVFGSAQYGSMWIYLTLILGLGMLFKKVRELNSLPILIMGNILSFFSSYLCFLKYRGNWEGYFKPLTVPMIFILIAAISLSLQIVLWKKLKNKATIS